VRLALGTWRLIRDLRPEGMPCRFRRPRHERVAQARRTLEAPGHPGLLATACRERREARVLWELCGRGEAWPWCAAGDEEAGSQDGPGPGQGVKPRAVGMVLGTWRTGVVEVGNGLPRDAEWGDAGLHEEDMGGADAVLGGPRDGAFDGLEAGVDDVGRAHVGGPEARFQGGAAREWHGFEGRPAAEAVAQDRRLLLGKPVQDLWTVVFEGTGQAVRAPDVGADQAPAVCDEWGEGPHGGALGRHGLARVTVFAEEVDRECRSGGVVLGSAGSQRVAVLGHGERMDGQAHEEIIGAPCRHDGPVLEFQAYSARMSVDSRAQGLAPRVDGFRAGFEAQALPPCSASGVSADIVCGIRPIEADTGGTCFLRSTCHV
jgi:hypothetical protein